MKTYTRFLTFALAATMLTACVNKEEQMRDAISDYLVQEIGEQYLKGETCVPSLTIVAEEKNNPSDIRVWCDCWVFWYEQVGDTLKTVSGGNHSGLMTIEEKDGKYNVTAFEQTTDGTDFTPSAKRIFGEHYDSFQNIHSNNDEAEAVRKEQLGDYVRRHNLSVQYYQDYGWDAVKL